MGINTSEFWGGFLFCGRCDLFGDFYIFEGEEYAVIYPIVESDGKKTNPVFPVSSPPNGQPEGVQGGDHHPTLQWVREYLVLKLGQNT